MKLAQALIEDGKKCVVEYLNGKYFIIEGYSDINELIRDNPSNPRKTGYKEKLKFLPSVSPEKIFLPAVNFRSHSMESDTKHPVKPYFFTKFRNALTATESPIIKPRGIEKLDYEGEIGIVIGKRGKYIKKSEAMDYVFGYTVVNDVSIRDYQFPEMPPYGYDWVHGKGADTALPAGPYVVTKDSIELPMNIKTVVNGEIRQNGTTDDMIFGIDDLISSISVDITLEPGDLISTGTPSGVAAFSGKRYLDHGDTVEVTVDGIGTLKNYIRFEEES